MEFIVSSDYEDQYFQISPYHAHILLDAFRKEFSYWAYRTKKYAEKTSKKPTCEQLLTLTKMEQKTAFFARQIKELSNGIAHCKRRDK